MKRLLLIFFLVWGLLIEASSQDWLILLGLAALAGSNHHAQVVVGTTDSCAADSVSSSDSYKELEEINHKFLNGHAFIVPVELRGRIIGYALVSSKSIRKVIYKIYKRSYLLQSISFGGRYIPCTIYALRFNN